MKVRYVASRGVNSQEWAEDIMGKALKKHVSKNVEISFSYTPEIPLDENIDILFLSNLAHTALYRRKIKGSAFIERKLDQRFPMFHTSNIQEMIKQKDRPQIIGGIRGFAGLKKSKPWLKYFDAIHTASEELKKECLKAGAKNVFVLNDGVDIIKFQPMRELRSYSRGLPFTIGWVGDTTKPVKNFYLLKKFGYPFMYASKENYIPYDEIPNFYNSFDVCVNMSTSEGFGRSIIEAGACGLPLISSDTGIIREVINDEWIISENPRRPIFIKEVKKKLEILKENPILRKEIGDQNRVRTLKFSWDNIATIFEDICTRTMEL